LKGASLSGGAFFFFANAIAENQEKATSPAGRIFFLGFGKAAILRRVGADYPDREKIKRSRGPSIA